MQFKFLNKNQLIRLLLPRDSIGALEFSDTALRFLKLTYKDGKMLEEATVDLPAGVIENGIIKDHVQLVSSLNNLKSQFKKKTKIVDVIVVIPSHHLYSQVFDLPAEAKSNLEEAAEFNLEAISPLPIADSYRDWQVVGSRQDDSQKLEILGAFIPSQIIEEYNNVLLESGFRPVAIEFSALALARLFKNVADHKLINPSILIYLSSAGLEFAVIKEGELRFQYFRPWSSLKQDSQTISLNDLKTAVIQELERVINFYHNRYNQPIQNIVPVVPGLQNEINQIITEHFSVTPGTLAAQNFPELTPPWFAVLGAGLRGIIPRSFDNFISLMSVGTEKEYQQSRVINFVSFWRNIFIGVFLFFVLIFIAGEITSLKIEKNLLSNLRSASPVGEPELADLQSQAKKFNNLLSLAIQAKKESSQWSGFLSYFEKLTSENRISIDNLSVAGPNDLISLIARAPNQEAVINFKNILIANEGIQEVDLPFTTIDRQPDGSSSFQVKFKIKDINKFSPTTISIGATTTPTSTSTSSIESATSSR